MEKHKCKLCSKRFGSGRALGGHMRSHFTILPLPTSSSEQKSLHLHPLGSRRDMKRSRTELKRLGKKRQKSLTEFVTESSMSETETSSEEEDLAMWLMLLSRDKWVPKEVPVEKSNQIVMHNGTGADVHLNDAKVHECQVCYKVFKSGQALGGHKRSHLLSFSSTTGTTTAAAAAGGGAGGSSSSSAAHSSGGYVLFIDLNLPAPLEDVQQISHTQIPLFC